MNFPKNIPWSEKYRADSFDKIKGQDLSISKLKSFLQNFPGKKAIVFHGPPGTGKTSLAYAAACELDAEILELNASDFRNKEKISKIIGPASEQKSLFKKTRLILVDEVDGISSFSDRGGLPALIEIIDKSCFPIIITANDIWNKKFSKLRRKTELVQFKEIDYKIILDILKFLCEKENCEVRDDVLTSIAIKSKGDLRAAINDLHIASRLDDVSVSDISERNKQESIFSALQYVFKNANLDTKMLEVFDNIDMNIDEIFLWMEENIPLEYKGAELERAFNALSRADVFRGRIYRQQYWRFMTYEYFFLGPGIASAKKFNRGGWTSYKKPSRILKIWMQNQRNIKKKSICQKYARYCHISTKQAMKEFMLIKIILKNQKAREELRLSDDEIDYLDKPVYA